MKENNLLVSLHPLYFCLANVILRAMETISIAKMQERLGQIISMLRNKENRSGGTVL